VCVQWLWYQIGAEESAIRQNPASVRDAVLPKALAGCGGNVLARQNGVVQDVVPACG
jgi:hypothetical protein